MALSALTLTKATSLISPSCSCTSFPQRNKYTNNGGRTLLSLNNSRPNKCLLNVGVGFLAASVLVLTPLNADATRIEYFATVGEPSCELNFVKSGLGYCDVVLGSGEQAPYGELVNVHYTARFADGMVFDSSYKRARPLTMRLGVGKVIKGLDQGILGGGQVPPMQIGKFSKNSTFLFHFGTVDSSAKEDKVASSLEGGKRKLKIPPALAYGPEPAGCFSGDCNIPANATLLYDINLVGIYSGNAK